MDLAIAGNHQHAKSGKLYSYEADYVVRSGDIEWQAVVHDADERSFRRNGTIAANTPAASTIAEQAVRDAVVTAIDALEDAPGL